MVVGALVAGGALTALGVALGAHRRAPDFIAPPPGPVVPGDAGLNARFSATAYPGPDGAVLSAWTAPPLGAKPTVVVQAGPGRRLADLAPQGATLADAGFGVWLLARRPGALPPGVSAPAMVRADLRAALDHLTGQGVSGSRLVLYAQTAAAGLVAQAALERPPAALILENPAALEKGRAAQALGQILAALPPDCRLMVLQGRGSLPGDAVLRPALARRRGRDGALPPTLAPFPALAADALWPQGGAAAVLAFLSGGAPGDGAPVLDAAPPGGAPRPPVPRR